MNIEHTILSSLLTSEEYIRRVAPHLKDEYFADPSDKTIYNIINDHFNQYGTLPTKEVLSIELDGIEVDERVAAEAYTKIQGLSESKSDFTWLIDQTESFCKERAYVNALQKCVAALSGKGDKNAGPLIMQEALSVSFETNLGHDYLDDAEERYEYYNKREYKVPISTPSILKEITKGGFSNKTLNILMGGTHTGKSLWMCHLAADNLLNGKNVLYITLEMAREEIARRIDTNLLNITFNELEELDKTSYLKKMNLLKSKVVGNLVIEEFPTGAANVNHFTTLLRDLKAKKGFVPDIIYIDYLNICSSARIKMTGDSYQYVKYIAEELRGMAQKFDVPVVSATQTNRSGFNNSDPGMENTSESFGLPMTADFMGVIVTNEELEAAGQYMFKQLKNRYNGIEYYKRFIVGVNKQKQQLYDILETGEDLFDAGIHDPIFLENHYDDHVDKVRQLF